MLRYFAIPIMLTLILLGACSGHVVEVQPAPNDAVKFTCVIFDGPASVQKFAGLVSSEKFTKWFEDDYNVGGQRIETPSSATAIGALVLTRKDKLLVMPICTWIIEPGHTYFACQSEAIGRAPMFSVCTESITTAEFLGKLKRNLSKLKESAE
ncbi:hypothetical protein N9Y42_08195 [Mariniblastus sp.]|nr:hypothetical protein [Mariniblastus sp.]